MTVPLKVDDLNPAARKLAIAAVELDSATPVTVPNAGPSSAAIATSLAAMATVLAAAGIAIGDAADMVQRNTVGYHDTDEHTTGRLRRGPS